MTIAVKKYCVKNGKTYGPYPKDSDTYYLYEAQRVGDRVIQKYLGKGPKPEGAVVQEKLVVQESSANVVQEKRKIVEEDDQRALNYLHYLEETAKIKKEA